MEHSYIVELKYCKADATDEQVEKLRGAAIAQVNRYADSDVVLTYSPAPSMLITNPRYRLPTKSEAAEVLRYADLSDSCWMSKQRILCVDDLSGNYYTFVPHSNVTKAGMKTKYCILPIRSERTREEGHVDITVNDKWE